MTIRTREVLGPHADTEPLADRRPRPRTTGQTPYASWFIIGASVLVFLGDFGRAGGTLFQLGALYGPAVIAGEWWRVLSTVFVHGGILHLALNMSVVYSLGMPLERVIGTMRFALLSLATALGSSALALFVNFDVPTVGASGMILGWAGAMLPIATTEYRRSLGIWLVQIAVISFLPGVSWAGHLGGFLIGLPCGVGLRLGTRHFLGLTTAMVVLATVICAVAVRVEGGLVNRRASVGSPSP